MTNTDYHNLASGKCLLWKTKFEFFIYKLFVLNSTNYHYRKSVILDRIRRGKNVYLRPQIHPFISKARCGESLVFCPGNDIWAFSVLWHRAQTGSCLDKAGDSLPRSDRAIPGTRPYSGLGTVSLSLSLWHETDESLRCSELCTGPAPGRERTTRGPAPRRAG